MVPHNRDTVLNGQLFIGRSMDEENQMGDGAGLRLTRTRQKRAAPSSEKPVLRHRRVDCCSGVGRPEMMGRWPHDLRAESIEIANQWYCTVAFLMAVHGLASCEDISYLGTQSICRHSSTLNTCRHHLLDT